MDYYEIRERLAALAQQHGSETPVCIAWKEPTADGQNLEEVFQEITEIETAFTPIGKRVIVLRP